MKSSLILIFTLIFILISGCERNSRQIAGQRGEAPKSIIQQSEDVSSPAVYARASGAGIEEILPSESSGERKLDGKSLFIDNCSACHQATGQGIPGVFPPLVNSHFVTSDNVDRLAGIMVYGLRGPIEVNGVEYNGVMAGLGGTLDDQELAAIATYIRSDWGNQADPVEADVFSNIREKHGTRGPFLIEELN